MRVCFKYSSHTFIFQWKIKTTTSLLNCNKNYHLLVFQYEDQKIVVVYKTGIQARFQIACYTILILLLLCKYSRLINISVNHRYGSSPIQRLMTSWWWFIAFIAFTGYTYSIDILIVITCSTINKYLRIDLTA